MSGQLCEAWNTPSFTTSRSPSKSLCLSLFFTERPLFWRASSTKIEERNFGSYPNTESDLWFKNTQYFTTFRASAFEITHFCNRMCCSLITIVEGDTSNFLLVTILIMSAGNTFDPEWAARCTCLREVHLTGKDKQETARMNEVGAFRWDIFHLFFKLNEKSPETFHGKLRKTSG